MNRRVTTGAHRMIPSITPPSVANERCQRCGRNGAARRCDGDACRGEATDSVPTDEPADTGTLPWHRDATKKDRLR